MAENKDNNITSVMEALVKGAESVFTTKTVVGEATKIDDTIIIPLVDVSFGIGAGASCGAGKDSRKNGGMGGMSGKMSPSAVLLIKNGQTRLVNIKNQDSVSKVIDMIPDLVDRADTAGDPGWILRAGRNYQTCTAAKAGGFWNRRDRRSGFYRTDHGDTGNAVSLA